jgi:hypothetical protein
MQLQLAAQPIRAKLRGRTAATAMTPRPWNTADEDHGSADETGLLLPARSLLLTPPSLEPESD